MLDDDYRLERLYRQATGRENDQQHVMIFYEVLKGMEANESY